MPADFAHLPAREAAIAAYIDRLPEGADISVKALAKVLHHGQCALRTALNFLQRAGHLRRGREAVRAGCDGIRWVTRTWFSRAARDDRWWAAHAVDTAPKEAEGAEDVEHERAARAVVAAAPVAAPATEAAQTAEVTEAAAPAAPVRAVSPPPAAAVPAPRTPVAERSAAYGVLAALGRRNSSVTLSAADCEALEPLAAEWFARGYGADDVLRALTDGLPFPVHHPAGLVRTRLVAKLPPELPPARGPVRDQAPVRPEAVLPPERVHALAAHVRAGVRNAEQSVAPLPV